MVRDRQFYRDFFAIWIVLVLQNVITLSVNLADNMMLGAYSETALAGVAAVNQIPLRSLRPPSLYREAFHHY